MRILLPLCLFFFSACAGAQRPAGDPFVTHVSDSLAEVAGARVWRFSFDVSKAWMPRSPREANLYRLETETRNANLFLQFEPVRPGETAPAVAGRLAKLFLRDDAQRVDVVGGETEARFGFYANVDGLAMAFQCRVRAFAVDGRDVWMVLLGLSLPENVPFVANDIARAASTAVLEPIEF